MVGRAVPAQAAARRPAAALGADRHSTAIWTTTFRSERRPLLGRAAAPSHFRANHCSCRELNAQEEQSCPRAPPPLAITALDSRARAPSRLARASFRTRPIVEAAASRTRAAP